MWRNAPMRVLSSQGDLVDSYDPALKEHRTVRFLAFDGHCYMYRAVKRVLERQAARVLYRGKARQTLPPIQEWRRFDAADVFARCALSLTRLLSTRSPLSDRCGAAAAARKPC